jgi:hypothetical protein
LFLKINGKKTQQLPHNRGEEKSVFGSGLAMKNKLFYALPLVLAGLVGCNRDLSPLNGSSTSHSAPVATSPCSVTADPHTWSDVETNPTTAVQLWDGGPYGVPISEGWATGIANTGCHSWKVSFGNTPYSAGYGHWFGYSFYAPAPTPPVPAGQANFQMSYLIDHNLTTSVMLDERASGEEWSTVLNLTASPTWQTISIPLTAFSGGSSAVDTQDIETIWFYNSIPYSALTLYIDDIKFN